MLTTEMIAELDFEKMNGLLPVTIQHAVSGQVLMLGYMNQEALKLTLVEKVVTFYSRSKNRLWKKGETSGNYLTLIDIGYDCDKDALLALVRPKGPTCHTGKASCFGNMHSVLAFIAQLETIIEERKGADSEHSYTAKLFQSGTKRIAQKVGEEGVEVALAATVHNKEEVVSEMADLLYHTTILLHDQGLCWEDVLYKLHERNQ